MADHFLSPRWAMLFSELLPTKKRRGDVRFDLQDLHTPEKRRVFFLNGKNLKEKHGGSSRAAKLHGVSFFSSSSFYPVFRQKMACTLKTDLQLPQ